MSLNVGLPVSCGMIARNVSIKSHLAALYTWRTFYDYWSGDLSLRYRCRRYRGAIRRRPLWQTYKGLFVAVGIVALVIGAGTFDSIGFGAVPLAVVSIPINAALMDIPWAITQSILRRD
jgi:hypothetical protein